VCSSSGIRLKAMIRSGVVLAWFSNSVLTDKEGVAYRATVLVSSVGVGARVVG
jgi:hypothetical protein